MSSTSNSGQNSAEGSQKQVEDVFEGYDLQDTGYVKEQLEFMESIAVEYPDGTTMRWEEEAPKRYEGLVESFGEVDEYVSHQDNGSISVLVEQDNEMLFEIYGEEQSDSRSNQFGLSSVIDGLSG